MPEKLIVLASHLLLSATIANCSFCCLANNPRLPKPILNAALPVSPAALTAVPTCVVFRVVFRVVFLEVESLLSRRSDWSAMSLFYLI